MDADGDGYGDPATAAGACEPPTDHVRSGEDCDDTDASANPRGREVPDDSIDQDCDGEDLTTPAPDTGDSGDTGDIGADDSGNDTAAGRPDCRSPQAGLYFAAGSSVRGLAR